MAKATEQNEKLLGHLLLVASKVASQGACSRKQALHAAALQYATSNLSDSVQLPCRESARRLPDLHQWWVKAGA